MVKLFFVTLLFFLLQLSVHAGEGEYAVSKIPPALLKDADAVLRLEEIKFQIFSTTHTEETNHYVITVLNENGDFAANLYEYYDKLRDISSIEGVLYDAAGKQLKHVKSKDFEDISGVSGSSLYDDNRVKRHNFYYRVYPYTIEYTIIAKYNNTMHFPGWIPQSYEKFSVEHSTISIICPLDYQFRYKAFNYTSNPIFVEEKNNKISTWSVGNIPAIKKEIYSPVWYELTTSVLFGPTDFEIDNYKGKMSSWEDFGKFNNVLKNGRDKLPDNVKQAVHKIADGISDAKEKISLLYEYMQQNTRYVSIQLGIGGWQPFDAKYVAAKAYGDCKALANYMYSILKEAGIPSCYTLIHAGKNAGYITDDFPAVQFNHAILSVPLAKDTMWLECTSQTLPAGYLGDFTCDRYALLIDDNGGHLVRTPKYGIENNLQIRHVKALLDEDATLQIKSETMYGGLQYDDYHALINSLSKDKVKEALHEQLDFATYDIQNFKYKENKSSLPTIDESLDISVSNYATITGKRLFIVPNIMTRATLKLSADIERKYDIQLGFEYKDIDTVEIELPKGYEPEALPSAAKSESKFGKYSASIKLSGDKITYYRSYEHYSGRFLAKDYSELVKFYEAIYKADRSRVVLVKKEIPAKAF